MFKMYSEIDMLNILKTSLSLKMSYVYMSNDRIIFGIMNSYGNEKMSHLGHRTLPHYYSICRLKILIIFVLQY